MLLQKSARRCIQRARAAALVLCAMLWCVIAGAATDALDAIYARKKLVVGTGLVVPPYNMLDDRLQPTGSDVELARLLARDMGVELEFVRIVSATSVDFLLAHKADVVISNFSVTAERQQVVDFSIPYGSIQSVLAGPIGMRIEGFKDLGGKPVAVLRGSTNEQHVREAAPTLTLVRYDSNNTLVNVMVSGQQKFVATAPALLMEMNRKKGKPFIEAKWVLQSTPYAIGMPKGGGKLRGFLDAWVQRNLANGKINAIYKRFHGNDLPPEVVNMSTVVR
jgi:polar amino acid transport system substrate-binding protein